MHPTEYELTSLNGVVHLILFAEILSAIASVLFVIISVLYLRHLDKIKKQRKLSPSERTIYIVIFIALICLIISVLIFQFGG